MKKILSLLAIASLAFVGYTKQCLPCAQQSVATDCPTATHVCCNSPAGNGGCCTALAEGCDGEGVYYAEFFSQNSTVEPVPVTPQEDEAQPVFIGDDEESRPQRHRRPDHKKRPDHRPPPHHLPHIVKKVKHFVMEHRHAVVLGAILIGAFLYFRKPTAAPAKEETKCTCSCGAVMQQTCSS